ncbi:hypothetical protein GBA52_008025 [Prunus armeniaca]|nr:hypothetical protein GBA52_008025 [Prunus armeniaca]
MKDSERERRGKKEEEEKIGYAGHCVGNKAGHEVTRFVTRSGGSHVWDVIWPHWRFNVLAEDANLDLRL